MYSMEVDYTGFWARGGALPSHRRLWTYLSCPFTALLYLICSINIYIRIIIMNLNHISKEEYFIHMWYIFKISSMLFLLGVVGVLHGLLPFLFTNVVSSKVKHLDEVLDGRS